MRRLSWRFWPRVICVALAFAATGCWGNDDLPRQPVYGTVTLDGKLLQQGVITFYPAEKMIKGPIVVSGDMIKNGRFGVSRKFGLIPGRYKVAVYSRPASTRRGMQTTIRGVNQNRLWIWFPSNTIPPRGWKLK